LHVVLTSKCGPSVRETGGPQSLDHGRELGVDFLAFPSSRTITVAIALLMRATVLLAARGVDFAGLLPPELQDYVVQSAGVGAGSKDPNGCEGIC
jgi:hypothetical protein